MKKYNCKYLIILSFCFLFFVKKGVTQTIYKSWFSSEINTCFNITDTISNINCYSNFKVKQKKATLKVVWLNNETFYGWQKERYKFNIVKLSIDSLVLSQSLKKNNLELLPDSVIRFVSVPNGCDEMWKLRLNKEDVK